MRKYTVDASVVLKSLLKENPSVSNKFKKILEQVKDEKVELISPNTLIIEVANGFRYELEEEDNGREFFERFLQLPIKCIQLTRAQYQNALSLAYYSNTTVYDSCYHVLAKANGAIFLTCDKDYFNKARSLGDIEFLE